ncbi:MAG TPA: hypothetical protein VIL36_15975, partial [Acidimicrobiales bacterium]
MTATEAVGRVTAEHRAVPTGRYPTLGDDGRPVTRRAGRNGGRHRGDGADGHDLHDDLDAPGDDPDDEPAKGRLRRLAGWRPTSRRQVLGLAAGGLGAVTAGAWFTRGGGDGSLVAVPPPPESTDRAAASKPSEAGGFANREASYTAGLEAQVNAA